ncbi:MAG: GAF domain-containing SpoIIE family protein phosphatase [Acidimicrobiales bacterium]
MQVPCRHGVPDEQVGELDWSRVDDPTRLTFLRALDETATAASGSLHRVTRVAATATGSAFAQISLVGSDQFVPAAHGLSYAPEQQHTPLRDSLCSVTMAGGATFEVADTRSHPWTEHLPPVTSGAVGSYLGVPLYEPQGRPIGALCVFNAEARRWCASDVAMLEDLAHLVTRELHLIAALESASVTEVRLRNVITELVDRPRLGTSASLQARAHYTFAAGAPAGGDWVDWIELGERVAFSIGDVAGHGLESIALAEELRHALRAYAIDRIGPAHALVKASELVRTLHGHVMATAMKAEFDPSTGLVRLAVAGHPPPIHLRDGVAQIVSVQPGPPLGVLTVAPALTVLALSPGDRLVLYTDGVIERRGEPLDVGMARLARAVEASAGEDDLAAAARAMVERLAESPTDDACLLLIERTRRS